jgi:hypothetical protein
MAAIRLRTAIIRQTWPRTRADALEFTSFLASENSLGRPLVRWPRDGGHSAGSSERTPVAKAAIALDRGLLQPRPFPRRSDYARVSSRRAE